MENKFIREIIKRILAEELKYYKTYIGKIIDVDDPLKRGRIKCYILELYWVDGESAVWVDPCYTRSMLKLKKDDYVLVGFKNGDRKRPYYFGISQELKDMIPAEYDGTLQVLFQSNKDDLFVTYDDDNKELYVEIGDNKYTINPDGIIREDVNGNKEEMTTTGIKWTDTNSNTIETTGTTVDINGNSKKFVTYTELNTALQLMVTAANNLYLTSADNGVTGGGLTLDISASESTKARTG